MKEISRKSRRGEGVKRILSEKLVAWGSKFCRLQRPIWKVPRTNLKIKTISLEEEEACIPALLE